MSGTMQDINIESRLIAMSTMINRSNEMLRDVANTVKQLSEEQRSLYDAIKNDTFNMSQAAEFLQCSTKTVERAINAGYLKYTLKGSRKTFTRKHLLEYQESRTGNKR